MDSVVRKRLVAQLARRPCTLLGVGPMSLNCVDAAVGLANRHNIDLMLVASRRQVDNDRLGAAMSTVGTPPVLPIMFVSATPATIS